MYLLASIDLPLLLYSYRQVRGCLKVTVSFGWDTAELYRWLFYAMDINRWS